MPYRNESSQVPSQDQGGSSIRKGTIIPKYTPFTNADSKAEWACARLDDLANWGKKVWDALNCFDVSTSTYSSLVLFIYCRLEFSMATDVWSGVLRRRDDALCSAALRYGSLRRDFPSVATSGWRHSRRGHRHQQDGAGLAHSVRPDAASALRHLDGKLREWRRLLPLLLLCAARLRPCHPRRHLRTWCGCYLKRFIFCNDLHVLCRFLMLQDAHRRPKLSSTESSCCRRRWSDIASCRSGTASDVTYLRFFRKWSYE